MVAGLLIIAMLIHVILHHGIRKQRTKLDIVVIGVLCGTLNVTFLYLFVGILLMSVGFMVLNRVNNSVA